MPQTEVMDKILAVFAEASFPGGGAPFGELAEQSGLTDWSARKAVNDLITAGKLVKPSRGKYAMAAEAKSVKTVKEPEAPKEVSELEQKRMDIAASLGIEMKKGDHLTAVVRKIAKAEHDDVRKMLVAYTQPAARGKLKDKSVRISRFDFASVLYDIGKPLAELNREDVESYFTDMADGKLLLRDPPVRKKDPALFKRQVAKGVEFCIGAKFGPKKALKQILAYLRPPQTKKSGE